MIDSIIAICFFLIPALIIYFWINEMRRMDESRDNRYHGR